MLETDGYGTLGFYSNGVSYFGQAIGSLVSCFFQHKIGYVKSMSIASYISLPFIVLLSIPAMRSEQLESTSLIYRSSIVYPLIVFTSFFNGLGQGVAQPSSGHYISDCANDKNKGFYFAFFWAFYMGS